MRAMAMLRVKELVPTTLSLFSGKYDKITITKTIFNKKKFISHFYTNIHPQVISNHGMMQHSQLVKQKFEIKIYQ